MKDKIKALLPAGASERLRNGRDWLQAGPLGRAQADLERGMIRVASKSPLLSTAYYLVASRQFHREHRAVLAGRLRYLDEVGRYQRNLYLLRRNTHRLEKGLLMQPRRAQFGLDYIAETTRCYVQLREAPEAADVESLRWAHDVLAAYFAVVQPNALIETLQSEFAPWAEQPPVADGEQPRVPYRRQLQEPTSISFEDFAKLAWHRRSVRWFTKQPVDRAAIDRAIEVAALAPTACNRMPYHFRVFDEPELVQSIAGLPMGTPGFAHNIPVIVAVVGQLGAFAAERDRHLIYIDGGLAVMSFCYGLETQGLSSCCINWPDVESLERRMAAQLKLAADERVIMLVAVGHPDPDGLVAYSQKKPLDALRWYNR